MIDRQSSPRPWPLASGAGDAGRRLARLLCVVLLFACLAPGISARMHATSAAPAPQTTADHHCKAHHGHDPVAGCHDSAEQPVHVDHADHGVYCGFCVLFSLLPVLPGTGAAQGTAALPRATGRPAGHRARPDVGDAVAAWLQQRQHGPPSRG